MIEVELPDGMIVEFPDGTSPDVMRQALQKRFGAPQAPQEAAPAPEGRGFFRRVDDAVRGVADAATFGFSDEIAAGLGSLTGIGGESGQFDQNLAAQRQRDATGGLERFGGQLAGAVAMPGAAAKSIMGAAGKGALAGGAYGFGSGEGGVGNRLENARMGAAVGGAAGGVLRAGANALGSRAAAKTIPSNDQLRKAAETAYSHADKAGVIIKPQASARLIRSVIDDATEFGYDPGLQPGVTAVLRRLSGLKDQNVTLKGMDIIRRVAANAAMQADNPSQQTLARKIIDRIDDHIDQLADGDILTGSKAGVHHLKEARQLWGRLRRSEMVDTAATRAELRAASTGSGGNADNATRQNVRRLIERPKGLTATEQKAADRVVRGTVQQNALRVAGKAAPTGIVSGGIGSAIGAAIGSFLGGPAGAAVGSFAVPAVGQVAKSAADRMTVKNVERLSQIIRSGGKSAKELATLARGGQLSIPQVKRVEALAKMFGITVPEITAIAAESLKGGV
jgi:hypothetical protein